MESYDCKGNCPGHYRKEIFANTTPAPVPSVYLANQFAKDEKADFRKIIELSKVFMLKAEDANLFLGTNI